MDLDFAADENLRELSGEEAWEAIDDFAQGQKEWDNPPNIIYEQELASLKAQAKRLFRNEKVWVEMHRYIAWDKVENPSPQNTPQILPSFKEHTLPVTYPEELKETLGIPMEVEPLDQKKLEDVGLDNCNHDISLSSKEMPRHSGSLGVDFSNLEMIEDDWELESKEVSFLGRGLNVPVRSKEVEKERDILHKKTKQPAKASIGHSMERVCEDGKAPSKSVNSEKKKQKKNITCFSGVKKMPQTPSYIIKGKQKTGAEFA
ncbi:hypothetical protein Tco_0333182 [Tanacetum coccineum]